jgi:hypothetical protein
MNELLDFIIQARTVGETNEQIVASLSESGWSSDQIAAALLEADKQIPPTFAIPVQSIEPTHSFFSEISAEIPPEIPALPEIPVEQFTPLTSAKPMYVNESAIKAVPKSHKKMMIVATCIVVLFVGVGYSYQKGLVSNPFNSLGKTKTVASVFADFEPIKKDTPLLLNDSVRFTITGFQLMEKDEFNGLQDASGNVISDGNQALLVYYTLQNLSEDARVITLTEASTIPFSIVDKNKDRIDVDSPVLSDSISNLAELKPNQYTSNALIFEVPQSISSVHDLYFLLQSTDAQPPKGYIQL